MNQAILNRLDNNVDFIPVMVEGMYDTPVILPEEYEPVRFVPFNTAAYIRDAKGIGIHFYIHDYLFQRLWHYKNKYLSMFQRFDAVMSPDFSMYTDFPLAVQIFNHYRNHLLAAWMQSNGVKVYPTILWSDEKSYKYCFDGDPHNATVCVSSVGTQKHKDTQILFLKGYDKMLEVLEPKTILFHGKVPKECQGNIIKVEPYYRNIVERRKQNDEA